MPDGSSRLGRLSRSGRYDLKRLEGGDVAAHGNDTPLGPEWLDHPLKVIGLTTVNVTSAATLLIYRLDGNAINLCGRARTLDFG